jgi:tetratricopeptide (TPR) repeat protein
MQGMPRSPGPEKRQSVPPGAGTSDDRTTERRLIPATPSHAPGPHSTLSSESTRDVAQEDFLFHLYRGSELLQENRVLEAKEELEFALTMQPSDPKGQDLLGAVYFRLGHYPRAIQIYEALEQGFPKDASIRSTHARGATSGSRCRSSGSSSRRRSPSSAAATR